MAMILSVTCGCDGLPFALLQCTRNNRGEMRRPNAAITSAEPNEILQLFPTLCSQAMNSDFSS
jgi:hypothetical protein